MPMPSNAALSPHFTAGELRADLPSATAGIVANCKRTAEFLEVIREALGNVPLKVTSGYRPPDYNAAVGGVSTSSHQDGLAADFVPLGAATMFQNYQRLSSVGLPTFDQLIYYPVQGHIHIGLGAANRREVRIKLYEGAGGTPYLTAANLASLPGYVADAVTSVATNTVQSVSAAATQSPDAPKTAAAIVVVLGVALTLWLA